MKKIYKLIKNYFPRTHAFLFKLVYGPRRYKHLYSSIRSLKASNILEVGVWNGKRAKEMIAEAKKYSSEINYFGFDLFEDLTEEDYKEEMSKKPPSKENVQKSLDETGVQIKLFSGNTLKSLPESVPDLPKMDFIFIDGGHSNKTVKSDWQSVSSLMKSSTIVIFDDYWRNRTDGGSKLTVDSIDKSVYKVEILPEVDVFDNPDFGRLEISFAKVTLLK